MFESFNALLVEKLGPLGPVFALLVAQRPLVRPAGHRRRRTELGAVSLEQARAPSACRPEVSAPTPADRDSLRPVHTPRSIHPSLRTGSRPMQMFSATVRSRNGSSS